MRILLLGAAGQVGFELHRALSSVGDVIPATRDGRLPGGGEARAIDLADVDALTAAIDALAPDCIVNASAYTAVDRAESEREIAFRVNGEAPGAIGRIAAARGARVVHFSTDYVFDGRGTRPWREDDPVDPVNAYGASKLAGEQALAASGCAHVVLRTAWVYASRGHNFLRTMLKNASRESLRIVDDQHGSPTTARWLADVGARAVALGEHVPSGIYHATCAGETTWHGFARAIFDGARAGGLIDRVPSLEAIPSAAYPTPAKRPAYSVLDGARLESALAVRRPDWRVGLAHVLGELAP